MRPAMTSASLWAATRTVTDGAMGSRRTGRGAIRASAHIRAGYPAKVYASAPTAAQNNASVSIGSALLRASHPRQRLHGRARIAAPRGALEPAARTQSPVASLGVGEAGVLHPGDDGVASRVTRRAAADEDVAVDPRAREERAQRG